MTVPERREADLGIRGVTLDASGLRITEEIPFEEWERIGLHLGVLRDMTSWALGDWIIAGEAMYGERAAQGVEVTGRAKVTLLEYARVARRVQRSRRRPTLAWTHHQIVAAKDPDEQDDWLDRAEANRWSVEELRGMIRDPAYPDRRTRNGAQGDVLELIEDVARAVLRARVPLHDGYSRIPDDVLDRLANAVGERA